MRHLTRSVTDVQGLWLEREDKDREVKQLPRKQIFFLNLTSIAFLIINTQLNPPNEEMQQFSELGMGSLWKKIKSSLSFKNCGEENQWNHSQRHLLNLSMENGEKFQEITVSQQQFFRVLQTPEWNGIEAAITHWHVSRHVLLCRSQESSGQGWMSLSWVTQVQYWPQDSCGVIWKLLTPHNLPPLSCREWEPPERPRTKSKRKNNCEVCFKFMTKMSCSSFRSHSTSLPYYADGICVESSKSRIS